MFSMELNTIIAFFVKVLAGPRHTLEFFRFAAKFRFKESRILLLYSVTHYYSIAYWSVAGRQLVDNWLL